MPYITPKSFSDRVKQSANKNINGKISFTKMKLSFFEHFPALTLSLYNVSLKGSAPFSSDTLLAAEELALGINLRSLIGNQVIVNRIFLEKAKFNVLVDSLGRANYNVLNTGASSSSSTTSESSGLKIEDISISRSDLIYEDKSLPMLIKIKGLTYSGKGNLSKEIFDLTTQAQIKHFDLYYDNIPYSVGRKIKADLITRINTNSLQLIFIKNKLQINQVPLSFSGKFEFLQNGYDLDFKLRSSEADLENLINTLPPQYLEYFKEFEIKGKSTFDLGLKGKYIAQNQELPSLDLSWTIKNGAFRHRKSSIPLNNIQMKARSFIPDFDLQKAKVDLDTLFFNIDGGSFAGVLHTRGLDSPYINGNLRANLDLGKIQRALNIQKTDTRGILNLSLRAEGNYRYKLNNYGNGNIDTILMSIPRFELNTQLSKGFFKYASMPNSIDHFEFDVRAACPDSNYRNIQLDLKKIDARSLNNYLNGHLSITRNSELNIDTRLKAFIDLASLNKIYPMQGMSMEGELKMDIASKGGIEIKGRKYPATNASVLLNGGYIKTSKSPYPVSKIQISSFLSSSGGKSKDFKINISPLSFHFMNQPFVLRANLANLSNLSYKISSHGILDIGKLYSVFASNNYKVQGLLRTNVELAGQQKDANNGNYKKLFNKGTFRVRDLALSSDLLPKPFMVNRGIFSFNNDEINFHSFKASFGRTKIALEGSVSNIIDYITTSKGELYGDFKLKSDLIVADEFRSIPVSPGGAKAMPGKPGVIMIPDNLKIKFSGEAKEVNYGGVKFDRMHGMVSIKNGQLDLQNLSANFIGTPVKMSAAYKAFSSKTAYFQYVINAKDFDIQKAYNSSLVFRELASSAAHVRGIVSLDYKLSGRLNGNMEPVYPSIKGNGIISVKDVKLKGFKLFNAVSKKTGHKDLEDPKLSQITIRSSIANNIISIERTRMKIAGFRPRIEGQVSFDGDLNLQFRLGLPPFGILGVPIQVRGSQENPKLKIGRAKEEDKLQDKEDEAEEIVKN